MSVLARHSARLGPPGSKLEQAISAITKERDPYACWSFMQFRPGGALTFQHYQGERRRFLEIYDQMGRSPAADARVRAIMASEKANGQQGAGLAVPQDQGPHRTPLKVAPIIAPRNSLPRTPPRQFPGGYMELPLDDVRFAHDDQSEFFGRSSDQCTHGGQSLLLLAVELLTNQTSQEDIPEFSVCFYSGNWYCRTGNRRLGALRLVAGFAPHRFQRVRVKVVDCDRVFLSGAPGRRPKLTTGKNGADCQGQWIFIRETNEALGYGGGRGSEEFGADLLAILPSCASGAQAATARRW